MKYTTEKIINTGKKLKFVFFWGHQPNKDGSIGKSCFSQWWEAEFVIDAITYKTAEHYMMAEKARLFNDEATLLKIIDCKSPAAAKKLGRQVKNFDTILWDQHKYKIVIKANYEKFAQNPELKDFLLQTKNRILVEASPVDKIWGIGLAKDDENIENPLKWRGLNLLGYALMEVRDQLQ
ncbi:NADAR family protein [Tenacibaculum sp. 190524A02b]|uniref:NADAR family protein n=1 Tax=Tenacibaculum vairaonense TaxID=3137860 RepID=UPI0031FB1D99